MIQKAGPERQRVELGVKKNHSRRLPTTHTLPASRARAAAVNASLVAEMLCVGLSTVVRLPLAIVRWVGRVNSLLHSSSG